jgi:hypothetical protein
MDYHFKNFNVSNWKFFGAWNVLKNTAKFGFHSTVWNNNNEDNNNTPQCTTGTTPSPSTSTTSEKTSSSADKNKENISPLLPTILIDTANAKHQGMGKKASEEKRRRQQKEKEKEAAKEQRHAKILASLEESKTYLGHLTQANDNNKKRNSTILMLGTTVLALKGSNDPEAVDVVKDCMALRIKKARATIDEDAEEGGSM